MVNKKQKDNNMINIDEQLFEIEVCPFCGIKHKYMGQKGHSNIEIICNLCGAVNISLHAYQRIFNDEQEQIKLFHLLHERHIKNKLRLKIKENIFNEEENKRKLLKECIFILEENENIKIQSEMFCQTLNQILKSYPLTIIEKLKRALCNIAKEQLNSRDQYILPTNATLFAKDDSEALYFLNLLIDNQLCNKKNLGVMNSTFPQVTLSLLGWEKFEELERNWQNSNTAFVAMWFSKEHTQNYRNAAEDAIRQAGYEPKIIDTHEHNNFIMDEIINQINEAKFVIADFTCIPEQPEKNSKIPGGVRGGVYFEAGYAKGLGKEVIVTCKDDADSKKRRHFDIDQLNTLFWNEKDGKLYDSNGNDFIHRLSERIKATVGKGKLII